MRLNSRNDNNDSATVETFVSACHFLAPIDKLRQEEIPIHNLLTNFIY